MIDNPENNILKNGDLEAIDSLDLSYKKMIAHIPNYKSFHDQKENVITPQNAYFYNNVSTTHTLPFYTCIDEGAISGNHSVFIRTPPDYAFIFFEQDFKDKSDYSFSAVVRGKTQTFVCIFCYSYHDKTCDAIQLCHFIIPDENLYKLTGNFTYDPVNRDAYFKVGAWIQRGEVTMDNFVLQKKSQ